MREGGWQKIGEGVWLKQFSLKLLGAAFNRTVTVFDLDGGNVLVHSTGLFSEEDYRFFEALGSHIHFVDATCFHDTLTKKVLQAAPEANIYAPAGFSVKDDRIQPIAALAPIVGDAIELIPLCGMPKVNEVEFYDRRNRLLVVADLFFNFVDSGPWTRCFVRATAGIKTYPGMSRLFRMLIKDKLAFQKSISQLRALEFDTLVFGHGQPIYENAKRRFEDALDRYGF